MNTPLVSICSITYNHAPFIRQCLDGFLMQQCNFPIEIIINDDCSTDGTTEIIREYAEKYPDKIFPVFHEENQWSKGERGIFQKFVFPKARGKYIALCEGDDYWTDPLKLQKQVDFLESHPECSLCCHEVDFIAAHDEDVHPFSNNLESGYYEREKVQIPTCSAVLRVECARLAPSDCRIETSDVLIWLSCWAMGDIYYMSDCMATYRQHLGCWNNVRRHWTALQWSEYYLSSNELHMDLFREGRVYSYLKRKNAGILQNRCHACLIELLRTLRKGKNNHGYAFLIKCMINQFLYFIKKIF